MTNALIQNRDAFARHHPETRVRVKGRTWGVISAGHRGPALVLLPGTLGRGDIFWQQIGALSPKARVLALTYPEQGGIGDWAEDIAALMAQHGLASATILGSSLGGYVAQYFTATRPGMADNLIAANTLPAVGFLQNIPPYSADITALPASDLMRGFTDGLQKWAQETPARTDLAALLLAEVESRIPVPELRARLNALKHAPALPPQTLPRTRIFTVESEDDHLIPPPIRAALRQSLNPQHSEIFATGSHFPYVAEPARYNDMIREIMAL